MTVLADYTQFDDVHWETGTIRNVLAYQGVRAPHTGKPYSEALLLGVSGGAAFGYFLFDYQENTPIISLITRNTFNPMDNICERLGIPQTILQTNNPNKGWANLLEVLEGGRPAIVWADMYNLPYNALPCDENNWGMMPVVVYGVDSPQVYIADRSQTPLSVPVEEFEKARARIKKFKFRVVSLNPPSERKLASAVQNGLWQCIRLYTEMPPKGARHNFGFAAYQRWGEMLTNRRNPQGWARFFPPGIRLFAALAGFNAVPGVYGWIRHWGAGDGAERGMYADFLTEAAEILNQPRLIEAANLFRASQEAWCELSDAVLPEEVPLFKQTRELLDRRHRLFIHQGIAALDEIRQINQSLDEIRAAAAHAFPLNESQVAALFERMKERVQKIHEIEVQAIQAMQNAFP